MSTARARNAVDATTSSSATTTSTKKKFGKNLNKLAQAKKPAPPITSPSRGSSRNGLLLLSTNKRSSSSGLLATSNKSPTKESTTAAATRPLGVVTEAYTSAHDALLGAVIGASRTAADPQQQPDAWGVASSEKQTSGVEGGIDMHDEKGFNDEEQAAAAAGRRSEQQGAYMTNLARERMEQRRREEDDRMHEQRERAEQRLRELEQKMAADKQRGAPSSLLTRTEIINNGVGGTDAMMHSDMAVDTAPRYVEVDADAEYDRPRGGEIARTLFDPSSSRDPRSVESVGEPFTTAPQNGSADPAELLHQSAPHYQMVNLSRNEDRDRGERSTAAGPRMLFDPKSGSMVEVKDREKSVAAKKGAKPQKIRSSRQDRLEGVVEPGKKEVDDKLKRTKGRKENLPKDDSKSGRVRGGAKKRLEPRLPRTQGVLYTRDKKGHAVRADGCDGDYGYGCHSVPGGRVRNPDAYNQLLESQQLYEGGNGYDDDQYYMSPEEPAKPLAPAVDWIKPNEKIELVTGAMDSPTLQATAREWAPSQAALKAAVAAKKHLANGGNGATSSVEYEDEEDDELDDDDEMPSFIGLGFDPAEHMDSMMSSPSVERSSMKLDSEGLAALALDAPRSSDPTSRNIFAFGGPTAWGGSEAHTQDLNGWSMLGSGNGTAPSSNNKEGTSFLSLSASNTWGNGGLLGGSTLGHSSDHGAAAD